MSRRPYPTKRMVNEMTKAMKYAHVIHAKVVDMDLRGQATAMLMNGSYSEGVVLVTRMTPGTAGGEFPYTLAYTIDGKPIDWRQAKDINNNYGRLLRWYNKVEENKQP